MNKRIAVYFILSLFVVLKAHAQLRFESLQEVWVYADAHNIQLQAAKAGNAMARLDVKKSYGAMLPNVTANGSFTDNVTIQPTLIPASLFNPSAPAGTFTEATFGRRYIYNGNIAAQFDIINTQDWFALKAAKLNNEVASLNIAKSKSDLYVQLANAYYSYVLLTEAERLSKDNLETTRTALKLAADKFTEGLTSEITVNTAKINNEKAAQSLDAAIQNKLFQLNSLRMLLNTDDSITITEKREGKEVPLLANTYGPDPNVQLSGMQVQLAKNQWRSSKAVFAPTLSAVYQYNMQIAGDEFLKFNNSNNQPQQYWGLRMSIPIFTGGTRTYQVQKARIEYNLREKEYSGAKLQSSINDENLVIAYNNALSTYNKSKEILALYRSNDMHAIRKLDEGVISLDDRLKTYADLIANQNEYLQHMSDYMIQQYRLQIRQINFTK